MDSLSYKGASLSAIVNDADFGFVSWFVSWTSWDLPLVPFCSRTKKVKEGGSWCTEME